MASRPTPALLAALLAAGLSLSCAGPAGAQDDLPSDAPAAAATPHARQLANQVERHIADLHRRLRITPAQQAQFDAFARIMRENAAHAAEAAPTAADGRTAVAELRAYADRARLRADDVQRLVPAFEALYAAMPQEQQKLADAAFREFALHGPRLPARP